MTDHHSRKQTARQRSEQASGGTYANELPGWPVNSANFHLGIIQLIIFGSLSLELIKLEAAEVV